MSRRNKHKTKKPAPATTTDEPSTESSSWSDLQSLIPDGDDDVGGEYAIWLAAECPVHSVVIAGVDIPKFIDHYDSQCPACGRVVEADGKRCARCEAAGAEPRSLRSVRRVPRRARKRITLTDAQLRAIMQKLDPAQPVTHTAAGRRVAGPTLIPGPDGPELLAPYVRIRPVDGDVEDAESLERAWQRHRHLRELARLTVELLDEPGGRPDPAARERKRDRLNALLSDLGVAEAGR
jgi:hypothetical protein